ncbi:MAG: 23S rRNA (uracil(1939)-C(5))-methyltransferase RlmD [Xanthomonadales bacterium]|nr:23S rRNA (uracil(1939)-C(5))-methyltransferase RlmD [Xanthomonadales bacterium]
MPADPAQIDITDLSHDGRGVGHLEGKAVFVHGALPGETVRFRYLRRTRKLDEGVCVEVLEASPDRVSPRCPHFHDCGGCSLQHMEPLAQILAKQNVLVENLRRIGGVEPEQLLPPVMAADEAGHWGYRRKARLSVRYVAKKGRVLVGFREKQGRFVCDMSECHTLIPEVGMRLAELSDLIYGLEAREQIPQVELAVGDHATVLVFRNLQPLSMADREALLEFQRSSGFHVYLQPKGPATIHPLGEPVELTYRLDQYDLDYHFTPTNFVQVNAAINQTMIAQALAKLELGPDDRVLDLFCGLGNFTLPAARQCGHIVGVEGDQELVQLAQANARSNGIENARFEVADLREDSDGKAWAAQPFDKVLLDPPRSGAAEVLERVAGFQARRLVYVSCHPGSLARDAGVLVKEHGYRLAEAGVMDMFPQTAHVESIALFLKGDEQGSGHGG